MSIQWLVENEVGYFRGPATVGVLKGKTGWILIDSGVEADVPKKIIKALKAMDYLDEVKISAVINTHAHADHCGGNKWVKANHQALIYASLGEKAYIENPYLEPHYLFSAESPKLLKNKFFQAEASVVDVAIDFKTSVIKESGVTTSVGSSTAVQIDGIDLTLVNIKGHSPDMMGILTSSGYFYCGDLLFTSAILEKHPLLFLHDYEQFCLAVNWVMTQKFSGVILTHGGYLEDHLPIARETLNRLETNLSVILDTIKMPVNEWEVHHALSQALKIDEDFGGWHLNHGVIRSYLGFALGKGLLTWENGYYSNNSSTN